MPTFSRYGVDLYNVTSAIITIDKTKYKYIIVQYMENICRAVVVVVVLYVVASASLGILFRVSQ